MENSFSKITLLQLMSLQKDKMKQNAHFIGHSETTHLVTSNTYINNSSVTYQNNITKYLFKAEFFR